MQKKILRSIEEGLQALEQLKQPNQISFIENCSKALAACFKTGNKVIVAGNGGSLCDAAHFAEELTGVFRKIRPALPAIVLNEAGHLSCVGNDLGYNQVFSRGVEAFGQKGDIFLGLTTSGRSANIVEAFKKAKEKELLTIAFLGKDGGILKGFANLELIIEGFSTSDRIQEAHMTAMHIIIEIMEDILFYSESEYFACASKDLATSNY